ncbi:MAG: cytochrome c-type biogenesis protein CcmH [Actinomycetota bacterium]|nr:cytochrome c-type biogenesis protein CcmH [Actinomycetota bacterium]
MKKVLTTVGIALVLVFAVSLVASAATPQDVANDISEQVMSPFCPGVTLHDCPSDNAVELRADIASWSASGMTKAEIMHRLINQYGDAIRAEPPKSGTGLLAWVLPAIAVGLGIGIAAWIAIRWSRRKTVPVAPNNAQPLLHSRIEAELDRLRGEL